MNFLSYSNRKNLEQNFYLEVTRILKSLKTVTKLFWKLVVLCLQKRIKDKVIVPTFAKGFLIKVGLDCFCFTSEGRTK